MAKYDITAPNGETYEVEAPDNASQEDVLSYAQSQFGKEPAQEEYKVEEAPVMAKIGRGMMDVAQGAKQIVMHGTDAVKGPLANALMPGAGVFIDKIDIFKPEEVAAYDKQLKDEITSYEKNNPGFDGWRMFGSFAATGGPLGVAANSVKGLMGVGAMYGVLQPATSGNYIGEKSAQAALGAVLTPVIGKALPWAASKGVDLVKTMGQQMTHAGREKIVADMFAEVLGPEQQRVAMELAKANPNLTVGQTLAGASMLGDDFGHGLIKLEEHIKMLPAEGGQLRAVYETASKLRKEQIANIAKTEPELATAINARESLTAPLYRAVEQSKAVANPLPVIDTIDDIIAKNPKNDAITKPLNMIKEKLMTQSDGLPEKIKQQAGLLPESEYAQFQKIEGDLNDVFKELNALPMFKSQARDFEEMANVDTSIISLKSVSDQIKTMMESTKKGMNDYDIKVLNDIRKTLDSQISKAEPLYAKAREEFARLSVPINQMKVGQELQERLTNITDTNETPNAYLRSIYDSVKTLKDSTGFARYKSLDQVLNPEQVKAVMKVGSELERDARQRAMAKMVKAPWGDSQAAQSVQLPHVLSTPVVITNAILKRIGKNQEPEYNKIAADLMANPQKLAELLKEAKPTTAGKIAKKIYGDILPIITAQVTTQAGARNIPISQQETQ